MSVGDKKVLTKNQLMSLSEFNPNKFHINHDKKLAIINRRLADYKTGIQVSSLYDFDRVVLPRLRKEAAREYFRKSQAGEIQTPHTPTDKAECSFNMISDPKVGQWYHLSWAFKGAKFKLESIHGDKGVVWTGKTKDKMLEIKLSDLRSIRK